MLIEAREQVGDSGGWARWLSKNFELNNTTAKRYMRWARQAEQSDHGMVPGTSLMDMEGTTERHREERGLAR